MIMIPIKTAATKFVNRLLANVPIRFLSLVNFHKGRRGKGSSKLRATWL